MLGSSLRNRVLTALVVLSIAPLLIVAYQGYHCGRMAVMDLMHLHVRSVTEARHAIISNWLDERVKDITGLIQMPIVSGQVERLIQAQDSTATAVLEGILQTVQATGQPYESLTAFDVNWNMLAQSAGDHAGDDFTTSEFQEDVHHAKDVYFGMAHPHEGDEVGSHLGGVIRNSRGETIGFLVANMNLTASLTPLLQDRSGLGRTGKAYIVDTDRRILTEPVAGATYVSEKLSETAEQSPQMGHDRDVHVYRDFLGRDVIGMTMPLAPLNLAVVVEIDQEESMEWAHSLLLRASLMVIAALCAVIAVSVWLSKLLGKPLAQLASVAHRISAGHTNERMDAMHLEEAEEVRRAFNRMLDELRNKEEEIVRSATLATVGELTSRVVHEMRNPLSSVKMNLQALRQAVEHDPENQELAAIATTQLQRLEIMLNELLQYGRPLELSWESISIDSLLDAVHAETKRLALEKRVNMAIENQLPGAIIVVDAEQCTRALVNLVKNAVEASPEGESVTIRVLAGESAKDEVLIEVQDSGSGIRPEHQTMLFKPFFTTKREGIGLGLANVKKIVELHSGSISARNIPPKGATFTVSLPRRSGPDDSM